MEIKTIRDFNKMKDVFDSHAHETSFSRLEADRRQYVIIEGAEGKSFSKRVYYPRIKILADGTYIMFHQDGRVSGNTFYSKSTNGLSWSDRRPLFTSYSTVRDDGEKDMIYYCNTDAIVMPDGEVLAFCSYRYRSGYNLDSKYCGIVMKRSSDNAETWSDEKLIYVGRNWESAPLLLKSGELQLYFSHTAPKFYYDKTVKTDSKIHTSSGSAIIRSFDGGHTWVPDVKEPPYAAHRVTQTYVETLANGTMCFTNQMPVAVELHNGDIALATESDMARGRFMLTMSYSHDNWKEPLGIDEDGPQDKNSAFDWGAGPYLVQFESGETLLSYNTADQFHLRLGDEYGKNLTSERDIIAFDGKPGYWGCLCVDTSHSVIAAMPYVIEDRTTRPWTSDNDMMICRYYLNHRINAKRIDGTQAKDGSFADCNTDALFLCAESGAQVCFSFAHDSENVYLRIDRLDETPDPLDCERLSILAGEKIIEVTRTGESLEAICDGEDLLRGYAIEKVDAKDTQDSDKWGAVAVMSIKKPCECDFVRIYAELDDKNEGGKVTSAFTGVNKDNTDTWFKVKLD